MKWSFSYEDTRYINSYVYYFHKNSEKLSLLHTARFKNLALDTPVRKASRSGNLSAQSKRGLQAQQVTLFKSVGSEPILLWMVCYTPSCVACIINILQLKSTEIYCLFCFFSVVNRSLEPALIFINLRNESAIKKQCGWTVVLRYELPEGPWFFKPSNWFFFQSKVQQKTEDQVRTGLCKSPFLSFFLSKKHFCFASWYHTIVAFLYSKKRLT